MTTEGLDALRERVARASWEASRSWWCAQNPDALHDEMPRWDDIEDPSTYGEVYAAADAVIPLITEDVQRRIAERLDHVALACSVTARADVWSSAADHVRSLDLTTRRSDV